MLKRKRRLQRRSMLGHRKMGGIGTLKFIVLLSVISLISYLSYKYFTADPAGYCSAQNRYIPDGEFIMTANSLYAWEMNIDYKNYPDGTISKRKDRNIDEYTRWEKNRDQPGSTKVYGGHTQSVINRMFGWQEIEVTLYLLPKTGDNQIPFLFDVCGKVLYEDFFYKPPNGEVTTRNYQKFTNAK